MRKDAFKAWSGHVIVGDPITASRGGHDISLFPLRDLRGAGPGVTAVSAGEPMAWLGQRAAAAAQFPQRHELDNPGSLDIELITRTPRKYGFHGTLKPLMRLAEGHDEAMLIAKAGKLAPRSRR